MPDPHTRVRQTDPITSRDASGRQSRSRSEMHRNNLLRLLRLHGAMTDHELEARYRESGAVEPSVYPPIAPSGLRTRRAELRQMGLVVDSGSTRPTASGSPSIVWEATRAGTA